ncbi:MAG: ABC transporter ATP-binding protein, partial [Rickettsiaceae bacterium]|nr:ABC transporter ATP-binding protein [Rickettsiaceae bacterium]
MSDNIIELKNISKSYLQGGQTIEVIKGASLNVKKGELVAIIGSSGSGKSTFLHIAGLLDRNFSGDVIIGGKSTKKLSESARDSLRLSKLGFVYQYHHLLKDFTAIENVIMPALISGVSETDATKRAEQLLSSLGLENRLHNFPGELSGGQQQRVAIARSMMNNPNMILADEPTGNLDSESSQLVIGMFLDLAKKNNLSAVIVTHNSHLASKMDSIYNIEDGILL